MDTPLQELVSLSKLPGNNLCCECSAESATHISSNIGIFLCAGCARVHRSMGASISAVKALDGTTEITPDDVRNVTTNGNLRNHRRYEKDIPQGFRKPDESCAKIVQEEWIKAKYDRLEFIGQGNSIDNRTACPRKYTEGLAEFTVFKKGKESKGFEARRLYLSHVESTLYYYPNATGAGQPKIVLPIYCVNATFTPEKIGNPNGLQIICYEEDKLPRSFFIYTSSSREIVEIYQAIHMIKHGVVAKMGGCDTALLWDFTVDGWLLKNGPKGTEGWKRRWCSLDSMCRSLYYYEEPLDAVPKGSIQIGNSREGYRCLEGLPPGVKENEHGFTIRVPKRNFFLAAESPEQRAVWLNALQLLIKGT